MDTPPPIKAVDTADVIGLLPVQFGFTPEESLCAIATRGARQRLGFSLRMDLPHPDSSAAAADWVVEHLRNQDADGAIVVAVSDDVEAARTASLAVLDALDALGTIEPVVVAWADEHRVWSTAEPDGVGIDRDSPHPGVVAAMVDGLEIVSRREDLEGRVLPATGPRRRWFDRTWPTVLGRLADAIATDEEGLLARLDLLLEAPSGVSDGDVLLVGAAVQSLVIRDRCWEQLSGLDRPVAQLAFWHRVARSVPGPLAAPPLCLAAIAAHRCGHGAVMNIALDRARLVEPLYPLTGLLTSLVERGIGPAQMDRALARLTPERTEELHRSIPHPAEILRTAVDRSGGARRRRRSAGSHRVA